MTFKYNDGTTADTTATTSGGKVTLPEPSREGYTFGGWFDNAACTGTAVTNDTTYSADTTLYAKWTENASAPAPAPAPTPAPSENTSGGWGNIGNMPVISNPAAAEAALKAEVKPASGGKVSLSWNKVSGAEKYVIYKQTADGLVRVGETKKTSLTLKNSRTTTYVIKYVKNGRECSDKKAVKITVEGTKPEVTAEAEKNSVKLDWEPVAGAEKYAVYKLSGKGKLVFVKETAKDSFRFTGLKSGKTYKYAVKAYVNGEWTKVTKSDIITVKTKK